MISILYSPKQSTLFCQGENVQLRSMMMPALAKVYTLCQKPHVRLEHMHKNVTGLVFLKYRKSSIRSRPCIILDSNFPRLVLEVHQILRLLEQKIFSQVTEVTLKTQKT